MSASESTQYASKNYAPLSIGNIQSFSSNQNLNSIDKIAADLNYSGASIQELASLLSSHANNELEKARIIYAWIGQHISYDVPAFLATSNGGKYPDVNPETVLQHRQTICSGYSNLYLALAEAMNLKSVVIAGYAKQADYDEQFVDVNHAWNAVEIDGSWYLLDSTWGAGFTTNNNFQPQYQPYYFATDPSQFIANHFPVDRGWQLLHTKYTQEKFISLPNRTPQFYNLGLELVSHDAEKIQLNNKLNIELKAAKNVIMTAKLTQNKEQLADNYTLVNHHGDRLIISVAPPSPGNYQLHIYAGTKEQDNKTYQEVLTYRLEAQNSVASLPKIYGTFNEYKANLNEPLAYDLPDNWSVYFNLSVPLATEVQVINISTNHWTSLSNYGNFFAGNVDIEPGQILVVAKFPNDDRYWHLVEYN